MSGNSDLSNTLTYESGFMPVTAARFSDFLFSFLSLFTLGMPAACLRPCLYQLNELQAFCFNKPHHIIMSFNIF